MGAAIFEELAALEQLRMADFGQHEIPAGAADQDTTPGASAIVQAIKKLKEKKTAGESSSRLIDVFDPFGYINTYRFHYELAVYVEILEDWDSTDGHRCRAVMKDERVLYI